METPFYGINKMILNLYRYRSYIVKTAWISFRFRYSGSSIDFFWNILQPLSIILLYFTVFSTVFASRIRGGIEGGTYVFALYLCAGYLPWNAMTESATNGANSFINNAVFLKKLPIPEQVFSAKDAVSASFGLAFSFVLLILISVLLGHYPSMQWLMLPFALLLFQLFAFGLGLFLGVINVFFRDVGQLLNIIFQIWFWSTPIVYPSSILPEFMKSLLLLNPAYHYIDAIREIFLYHHLPGKEAWATMLAWSAIANIIAFIVLKKLRPEIRDCI